MKRIILTAIMAGLAATAPAQTTSSSDEGTTVRIYAPEYRIDVKSRLIINALNKKVGLQALPFF